MKPFFALAILPYLFSCSNPGSGQKVQQAEVATTDFLDEEEVDAYIAQKFKDTAQYRRKQLNYLDDQEITFFYHDKLKSRFFKVPFKDEASGKTMLCYYFDSSEGEFFKLSSMKDKELDFDYSVDFFSGDQFFDYFKEWSTGKLKPMDDKEEYRAYFRNQVSNELQLFSVIAREEKFTDKRPKNGELCLISENTTDFLRISIADGKVSGKLVRFQEDGSEWVSGFKGVFSADTLIDAVVSDDMNKARLEKWIIHFSENMIRLNRPQSNGSTVRYSVIPCGRMQSDRTQENK